MVPRQHKCPDFYSHLQQQQAQRCSRWRLSATGK